MGSENHLVYAGAGFVGDPTGYASLGEARTAITPLTGLNVGPSAAIVTGEGRFYGVPVHTRGIDPYSDRYVRVANADSPTGWSETLLGPTPTNPPLHFAHVPFAAFTAAQAGVKMLVDGE